MPDIVTFNNPTGLTMSGNQPVRVDLDKQMIGYLHSNNEADFGRLYDHYAPVLFGMISKSISDQQEAERVLQAVMTDICTTKDTYDENCERLLTWMLKKVRTHVNQSHKKIISNNIHQGVTNVSVAVKEQNVDQSSTAFELIYCKGYTFAETSSTLNIPPSTLLTMLRQVIGKYKQPLS